MATIPTSADVKDYIRRLIVENGVSYVNAYVTGSTSRSSYCQNVRICLGIQGVSSDNRKTFDITSCINSKLNNVYQPANNGESIVRSISGAYPEVNHGTNDTTFTLTPNTFHVWGQVASLTLNLGAETSDVANEYIFQFTSGPSATSLTLPSDIKWANDSAPTIVENMIYQVSILKGLACILEFNN